MSSIGAMRHRLEFLNVSRTDDDAGGFDTEPTVENTVWAAIRPASMGEIDRAGRLQQRLTHIAEIRWSPEIEPKQGQAVRWRDRRGAIRVAYVNAARDPTEEGRFMEIMLREGGPAKGV